MECVTIVPKIILQNVWRIGRDTEEPRTKWDGRLPSEGAKGVAEVYMRIEKPGWTTYTTEPTSRTLYIGSDHLSTSRFFNASSMGYSAIVYFRSTYQGEVNVAFVTARARVAPVDQLSIPRLELLAGVLGYRLGKRVQGALKATLDSTT